MGGPIDNMTLHSYENQQKMGLKDGTANKMHCDAQSNANALAI